MHVKVTKDFQAVRPNEVYPTTIAVGEVVDGRLAEIAIEQKKGEEFKGKPVPVAPAAAPKPDDKPPAPKPASGVKAAAVKS